jgi:hypothetical protein
VSASLLLVFLAAKLMVVWGRTGPMTMWSIAAYCWQDVLVAVIFALVEFRIPRIARPIYWCLAVYTAINIPVGRVLSTPLTWPMLRAARGPLADSMRMYATVTNAALVVGVLALAAILPRFVRGGLRLSLALLVLGPIASSRVDTHGMDRNVLTALISLAAPVRTAGFWRPELPTAAASEDLSRFRGAAKGFNIVMVSLESTAAQYVSSSVMPHLTSLEQHAVVFENAYAVYPESIKGLFSVLCSQFPAIDRPAESYEHAPCESLPSTLTGAGYRTGLFHSGRFGYLGMESIIRRRGYQMLEDAGDIGGNHQSSFGVDEPATVSRILRWIDADPQPFFLTYLPIAGHHPYATPERGPFPAASEFDQYRNALHYGDESLGALADGLRARGLETNTVWVIYGDHGEAFGQHLGNYGHTFFVYEENVHVPLLMVVPGTIQRRLTVQKVVSLVDLAPTILDLAGLHLPGSYQGRTMLNATGRPAFFFADYSLRILGLREGPWKFIYELDSGRTKLFDLEQDPAETCDLATREATRSADYRRLLQSIYYH